MRSKLSIIAVAALALATLAGCQQMGYTEATTIGDKAVYSDAAVGASAKTLGNLTCRKYLTSGQCSEAGRPLHPAMSKHFLDVLDQAHLAAMTARKMPTSGGACLGQPSTPTACLQLANDMLQHVQHFLAQYQGVKQ